MFKRQQLLQNLLDTLLSAFCIAVILAVATYEAKLIMSHTCHRVSRAHSMTQSTSEHLWYPIPEMMTIIIIGLFEITKIDKKNKQKPPPFLSEFTISDFKIPKNYAY